jgi:hypothetical protein
MPILVRALCSKPRNQVPAGPDWIHEIKHDGYGVRPSIIKGALSYQLRLSGLETAGTAALLRAFTTFN